MNAAGLAGLLILILKAAIAAAIAFEFIDWTDGQTQALLALVVPLVDFAIILATMYYRARPRVTPNADPVDTDLHPLVRKDRRPLAATGLEDA